jgi:hypothetical protein
VTFVVRNDYVQRHPPLTPDHRYLARDGEHDDIGACTVLFKDALRFETLEEAETYSSSDRKVFALTYALRWFDSDGWAHYYRPGQPRVGRDDAERYLSPEIARKLIVEDGWGDLLFGAGGPDDKAGYKTVRLLKRVT